MEWRSAPKKRSFKRFLYSPLGMILLILLVGLLARGTWGVYTKEKETRETTERLTLELEALKSREATLRAEVDRLSTKEGVEVEIRKKFGVVAPGEKMVILPGESSREEDLEPLPKSSWWQKMKDLFR